MKKISTLALFMMFVLIGHSQLLEKFVAVDPFTEISVSNALVVNFVKSDKGQLEIKAKEGVIDAVKVSQKGEKLNLTLDTKALNGKETGKIEVIAYVQDLPTRIIGESAVIFSIKDEFASGDVKIELKQASQIKLKGRFDNLNINLESASVVNGEVANANTVTVIARQASQFSIEGMCKVLKLYFFEASIAELEAFKVQKITVSARTASHIHVNEADNILVEKLSEASTLKYHEANTVKEVHIDASSSVKKVKD